MASDQDGDEDNRSSSYYDPPDDPTDSATNSHHPHLYPCILEAIHSIDLLQSEISLSRDRALEVLTKVIYKNHKHILQSVQVFRVLEETGRITRYRTLRFLRKKFYHRQHRTRAVKSQEQLILVQQKRGFQQGGIFDLIRCIECNEKFPVQDYERFGRHVFEHFEGNNTEGGEGEGSNLIANADGNDVEQLRRLVVSHIGIKIAEAANEEDSLGRNNYRRGANSISKADGKRSVVSHNAKADKDGGRKNYVCSECNKTFKSGQALGGHIKQCHRKQRQRQSTS